MKVVGEASDSAEAIFLIGQLQPNLAILDIRLNQGSGFDVVKACKQSAASTRILIFTAYDDDQYVRSLVRLGVRGYLLKTASAKELRAAVHDIVDGKLVFAPDITHKVLNSLEARSVPPVETMFARNLTKRESDVLGHLTEGLTNREIASQLGVSTKTVESHVRGVLLKLGAKSRTEAVIKVLKSGHNNHELGH